MLQKIIFQISDFFFYTFGFSTNTEMFQQNI